MQGRILFVAGATIGYVLGARAGRRRYDQIKAAADRVWNDRNVQKSVNDVVGTVQGFVKEKAPEVQDAVVGQAKKVVSQVTKRKSDQTAA
jgi:oxygen-dependent protoporphyrinogen oxidase